MRGKEMHPLCCISVERSGIGDQSPRVASFRAVSGLPALCGFDGNVGGQRAGSDASFAGVLYKWTNFGKGWRSRWFILRNGVLSYSKIPRQEISDVFPAGDDVRMIGDVSCSRLSRLDSSCGRRKHQKALGIVHLKQVSSFRESKSDDRRFYIFTATKTLHLRTKSKKDRTVWIEALVSTRNLFSLRSLNDGHSSFLHRDISISTEKLKKRLLDQGLDEAFVNDCQQIILSEFSEIKGQFSVLCEERSILLDTLRQLEAANTETEGSGVHYNDYQLIKNGISTLRNVKYSECSTTTSSDDIDKQEVEDVSDEEENFYYDAEEKFSELPIDYGSITGVSGQINETKELENFVNKMKTLSVESDVKYPQIERRKKLPDPVEKEKGVSLWSMIKDNVGKDLTRVCLPVYFNEPISSLQKCYEDMEYSYLLDHAYKHGKEGNCLLRILYVAAFAVSGYASSEGRHCKPFNPLLGETFEADYPDKGLRFISEKVSHHPTLIACHCEGRGWKFWGDSNLKSKFWGRSIQLNPTGVLTLEFDDGEIFQWSKVTTSIYNLILGKLYCDHHGIMEISGNRQYSCKIKFKEQAVLERNPRQVNGFVEDENGKKVATLFGKWDDSVYYVNGDRNVKGKEFSDANLLWKRVHPPPNLTRYNLTSFAITLNEITPGLQEMLPLTDSRLRPDQRYLENGEYEKANAEKLRLEMRQRMSRKLQENGWKPRWFHRESEQETFQYIGGYWETREKKQWDGCPNNIFGEFEEEDILSCSKSST